MFNRKLLVAASLWTTALVGCSVAPMKTSVTCPVSITDASVPFTPQLGAGDALGRKIFTEDRLAKGPVLISTPTASIAE